MKASVITEVIRRRRSIFPSMYSGERVEDSIIMEMLENANHAPTHKLTSPWRFTVFTKDGLKTLGKNQAEIYKKRSEQTGDFSEKKHSDLSEKPLKASHVIAISMKRDEAERIPEWEEISSVAAAVQNMYLTASANGIGCYWGTGGITSFDEAKTLFELGANDKFMGFLYVGMPASFPPERERQSIQEKINWVDELL